MDWRSYLLWAEGVLLLLLAVSGLVSNGFGTFTGVPPESVSGFQVNTTHGLLLLLTGLAALACSPRGNAQRHFLISQFGLYLVLFFLGVPNLGNAAGTLLGLSTPDVFLHAGLAILGVSLWLSLALQPDGQQNRS